MDVCFGLKVNISGIISKILIKYCKCCEMFLENGFGSSWHKTLTQKICTKLSNNWSTCNAILLLQIRCAIKFNICYDRLLLMINIFNFCIYWGQVCSDMFSLLICLSWHLTKTLLSISVWHYFPCFPFHCRRMKYRSLYSWKGESSPRPGISSRCGMMASSCYHGNASWYWSKRWSQNVAWCRRGWYGEYWMKMRMTSLVSGNTFHVAGVSRL